MTLSNPSDQEDFNPNAMSDLSRSLKAEAAGREPSADEADSAPETDSTVTVPAVARRVQTPVLPSLPLSPPPL